MNSLEFECYVFDIILDWIFSNWADGIIRPMLKINSPINSNILTSNNFLSPSFQKLYELQNNTFSFEESILYENLLEKNLKGIKTSGNKLRIVTIPPQKKKKEMDEKEISSDYLLEKNQLDIIDLLERCIQYNNGTKKKFF